LLRFIISFALLLGIMGCADEHSDKPIHAENVFFKLAHNFNEQQQLDSAYYYFELAKEQYLSDNDSIRVAECLLHIAAFEYKQGDYYGAQETVLGALPYLKDDKDSQDPLRSYAYNLIANAADDLAQFEQAIPYYEQAIHYSTDSLNTLIYKNNLAVCLRNAARYSASILVLEEILASATVGTYDYAKFLNNLAKSNYAADKNYNPIPSYHEALAIRLKLADLWGQNSSYSSLAQYYKGRQSDSMLYYLHKQYAVAKEIHSADDQITALRGLVQANGTYAALYLPQYLALSDSVQQARMAAKNQFALVRYESEKNKTKSLQLEKENEKHEAQLFKQLMGIGFLLFLMLVSAIIVWIWNKRKHEKHAFEIQHQIQEGQHKIRETQLQLSKKIHDVVANGIYRVMMDIGYNEEFNREHIVDRLDIMYKKSRDISHEEAEFAPVLMPYEEEMADLLKSFAAKDCRISIVGNEAQGWEKVSKGVKSQILVIMQELMVNMQRHSQADQVVLRFDCLNGCTSLFYKDNGIGMTPEKDFGKGLSNTVSRIEDMQGQIIFVSEEGQGLTVKISIPQ